MAPGPGTSGTAPFPASAGMPPTIEGILAVRDVPHIGCFLPPRTV
ncbi:MAG: hypothetical protein ACLPR9_08090 [Acidimicrobiales bacterium]